MLLGFICVLNGYHGLSTLYNTFSFSLQRFNVGYGYPHPSSTTLHYREPRMPSFIRHMYFQLIAQLICDLPLLFLYFSLYSFIPPFILVSDVLGGEYPLYFHFSTSIVFHSFFVAIHVGLICCSISVV